MERDDDLAPPRIATQLLRRCLAPAQLEAIAGDLFELYDRDRARVGPRRAAARYSLQVASILMHVMSKAARKPRSVFGWQIYPLRVLGVALATLTFTCLPNNSLAGCLVAYLALAPELHVALSTVQRALRRVSERGSSE